MADTVDIVIAYSDTTSEIGTIKTVPKARAQAMCADGRARIATDADREQPQAPTVQDGTTEQVAAANAESGVVKTPEGAVDATGRDGEQTGTQRSGRKSSSNG